MTTFSSVLVAALGLTAAASCLAHHSFEFGWNESSLPAGGATPRR